MPAMSFLEHLEELRKRLFYSIIAIAVGMGACWGYHEAIFGIMQRPIMDALHKNGLSDKLVYLNPTEPFNLYLKIALVAGVFVASPVVLYQVWMFISPGLYRNEKQYVFPFMFSTIALFVGGGIFRIQAGVSVCPGFSDRLWQAVSADDHDRRVHQFISYRDPWARADF